MDEWAWSELSLAEGWNEQMLAATGAAATNELRAATYGGRPFGDETFVIEIERLAGRPLRKQRPGPKRKTSAQTSGADRKRRYEAVPDLSGSLLISRFFGDVGGKLLILWGEFF